MANQAPDLLLYRQIVDVLVTEHNSSRPPDVNDGYPVKQLACTWGIYCQIHRFARAAVLLIDNEMGREANVIVRVMLEHTVVLHWIIERGDEGVDALLAKQSKQMKTWLRTMEGSSMVPPPEIVAELHSSFIGIDETKAVKAFKDTCEQIGAADLYVVYGFQSGYVHPTTGTSNAYCDELGNLTLVPSGGGHPANISLVAHCLIWAERDFDRLKPQQSRADQLGRLAVSIRARPVLPEYRSLPPAASRARNTRRHRQWPGRQS
jgi:hypothetical protein